MNPDDSPQSAAAETAVRLIRNMPVVGQPCWEEFKFSGVDQESGLKMLRNLMADSLERERTRKEFECDAQKLLLQFQLRAGNLRRLWNTVTGQALEDGRKYALSDPEVARVVSFRLFDAMIDFRVRPNHAALENGIAPGDWPGWATYSPPLGDECRCTLIGITAARARRMIASGESFDLTKSVPAGAGPDPGYKKIKW